MQYGYTKKVEQSFTEALERTRAALAEADFGILTEIDVAATLKQKLGVDMAPYVILGACNPPLAHQALVAEPEIGLLLPCNVIVYEQNSEVFVSAILPSAAMSVVENEAVAAVAEAVEAKLKAVVDVVKDSA